MCCQATDVTHAQLASGLWICRGFALIVGFDDIVAKTNTQGHIDNPTSSEKTSQLIASPFLVEVNQVARESGASVREQQPSVHQS